MNTLLINGQILTMDAQMSVQQALAIRGDRIQAVGDNEALRAAPQAGTHIWYVSGDRTRLEHCQPWLETKVPLPHFESANPNHVKPLWLESAKYRGDLLSQSGLRRTLCS